MENIFENAYFGKAYKTSDGRKVIFLRTFICNGYNHYVSNGKYEYSVEENGKVDKSLYPFAEDIVSEWQEEINEEEIDNDELFGMWMKANESFIKDNHRVLDRPSFVVGVRAGYHKAKEE